MLEINMKQRQKLHQLFKEKSNGHMAEAILEGHMGKVWADPKNLSFAILEFPDTQVSILAGDSTHPMVTDYLKKLPRFSTLFFTSKDFETLTQLIHPKKWVVFDGYNFSSESLSKTKLQTLKTQLPAGFTIKRIDLSLAKRLIDERENSFADHHGANFTSSEDFVKRGFGYCVLQENEIACVASTFTICDAGMDIQIDTKRKFRGNGLATATAAHLILHSLEHNLDPSWDAANEVSANLAKKLGYTPSGTYKTYVFTKSRALVMLRNVVQKFKPLFTK